VVTTTASEATYSSLKATWRAAYCAQAAVSVACPRYTPLFEFRLGGGGGSFRWLVGGGGPLTTLRYPWGVTPFPVGGRGGGGGGLPDPPLEWSTLGTNGLLQAYAWRACMCTLRFSTWHGGGGDDGK